VSPLIEAVHERARTAGGRISVVVLDADGSEVLAISPDEPMRAASVIKLPLVMTLFLGSREGIDLDERVSVGTRVAGSGVLSDLPGVTDMTLRDLASITLTVSDNTAANRLIDRVGIERVNERLDEWGCGTTRLRRAMYDLEAKARGLENVMSARETASLLRRVLDGANEGDAALARLFALLSWNSDRTRLGRYLPPGVALAHKDGWDTAPWVDNDAGIVRAAAAGSPPAAPGPGVVVVGFTNEIDTREARSLLGLLGLAAAELAGADIGTLPSEVVGSA
jgi:beta-lactamase class A